MRPKLNRNTRDRLLRRGRSRPRRKGALGRRAFAFLPAPFVLAGIFIVLAFVGASSAYAYFALDLPPPSDLAKDPLPLATKVYARDGTTLLYEFAEERREHVEFAELPKTLIDATIAAEDKSFWTNPGVDVGGILRAVYVDVIQRGGDRPQGASTITQQLVKQRIVGGEINIVRKIKEALLAIEVTRTFSKQDILELYFNQIYYGAQAYGVKAAALTYFGSSDLSKLTLAQAALLAGLPQAPSGYDPTQPENIDRATARRNLVLDLMAENGFITTAQARAAKAEPIKLTGTPAINIAAPHFVFQVRNQLAQILGNDAAISRGGYAVVTSLDWPKQQEAEKQVKAWVEELHEKDVWNAALVSIHPKTGEVLAYVGSVDYYNTKDPRVQGQFDVAGIGVRQPGSAFKMFNYVTALKKGATPATVVVDARTTFGTDGAGKEYRPENADLQYHGPLTMRQAIRESRNVPAIKFLQQYSGIEDTIRTAQELGITADFAKAQAGLSLTLGAVPVKLIDMTSAYGVLANMGVRVEPTFILKVTDPNERVVWEHSDFEQRRIITPELAWLMTDILKDTTQPSKSFIFGSWTNIGRVAALKTGTTDNLKDVYSVGYTPQIVTGVWMGNSDGTPMVSHDFFSAMGPGQLWREYMKAVLKDVKEEDWPRPAGIVDGNVAAAPGAVGGYGSGLLPSSLTPFVTTEHFIKGTVPARQDDWFQIGCTGKVVMVVREPGPASWHADTAAWVTQAMAGRHGYNRYNWPSLLSTGMPCATPSPTPTPSPSGIPGFTPFPTPTKEGR